MREWLLLKSEEPRGKSRFTDEHIVTILREADKTSVVEASKRNKVSEQSIFACRKHFGSLAPADLSTVILRR